jgi:hypothetical protein
MHCYEPLWYLELGADDNALALSTTLIKTAGNSQVACTRNECKKRIICIFVIF